MSSASHARSAIRRAAKPIGAAQVVMLRALLDGTWRPAGELARAAGIAVAVAAAALEAMVAAGVLTQRGGARRPYYGLADPARVRRRLASPPAATMAAIPAATRNPALRAARTCYGHLAGHLGVALCHAWQDRGWLGTDADAFHLQPAAAAALLTAGWPRADVQRLGVLAGRPCVDWTERRIHVGGPLGKSLAQGMVGLGWLRRVGSTRAVALTAAGRRRLAALGVAVPAGR